jgi:hypothetical protein
MFHMPIRNYYKGTSIQGRAALDKYVEGLPEMELKPHEIP